MVLFGIAAFLVVRDVVDGGGAAPATTTAALVAPGDHAARRDENIRFFELRAPETNDSLTYNTLVGLYLQRYRETGDANDIGRAERAALRSNEVARGNYGSIVSLAAVRLAQHDFAGAESLARDAIARRPVLADAHALLGDALFALGRYSEAGDEFAIVLEEAPGPAAFARQAAFAEVRGKHAVAEQFWRAAIDSEQEQPENLAWAHVQLGTLYFSTGQLGDAADAFERALAAFDGYPAALAGLARVAASRGALERAADLFSAAIERAPQAEYAGELGDVFAAMGDDATAERQYALVGALRQLFEANGVAEDLAIVQFEIDHGAVDRAVVERARALAAERPSVEALDALAWAHYRNGDFARAQAAMSDALEAGTLSPRLAFHAAAIAFANGDVPAAQEHFERLDDLNAEFSVLYAREIADLRETLATKGPGR
jgi:tetratricopeptide (TPR) repeat protein